jgi:predicted MFS family arabinose efflux permease
VPPPPGCTPTPTSGWPSSVFSRDASRTGFRAIAERLPVARLRERLEVARQPVVLVALLVTMLWATGAYAVYTYLASFLSRAARLTGSSISAVLFTWGVAAVIGLRLGGRLD